jgi:vacuolar-type H+-ATPase subunit I/STV1
MPNPIENIDNIELTEAEIKSMDEYIKTLPKDIQLYFYKLKKKVANCNIRINKIEKTLDDIEERLKNSEDNVEVLETYNDEHEILSIIVRKHNKGIEKEYLSELAKMDEIDKTTKECIEERNQKTPLTNMKPWKPGMSCINCLWGDVTYDATEKKTLVICDGINSPSYQKAVSPHDYCFKYYEIGKKNNEVTVYKPEKQQPKKLYIENTETGKSKEIIIET